ncbi:MAG: hypothetical protein ACRDTM_05905 [Micromonosporaceae bacterium]
MHPQQTPPGVLSLHTKYPFLAFMLALFKPKATINGHVVPLVWGQNQLPLPPGAYHLKVHVPYLWPVGVAEMQIDARQQPAPPVYYAAPWIAFMRGAIGHQQVESPGKVAGILLGIVLPALILVCLCGSMILGSIAE